MAFYEYVTQEQLSGFDKYKVRMAWCLSNAISFYVSYNVRDWTAYPANVSCSYSWLELSISLYENKHILAIVAS